MKDISTSVDFFLFFFLNHFLASRIYPFFVSGVNSPALQRRHSQLPVGHEHHGRVEEGLHRQKCGRDHSRWWHWKKPPRPPSELRECVCMHVWAGYERECVRFELFWPWSLKFVFMLLGKRAYIESKPPVESQSREKSFHQSGQISECQPRTGSVGVDVQ